MLKPGFRGLGFRVAMTQIHANILELCTNHPPESAGLTGDYMHICLLRRWVTSEYRGLLNRPRV